MHSRRSRRDRSVTNVTFGGASGDYEAARGRYFFNLCNKFTAPPGKRRDTSITGWHSGVRPAFDRDPFFAAMKPMS